MPHSLRAKLKGLNYKKILTDRELERLCKALDNENVLEQIRAEIEEERVHDDWDFGQEIYYNSAIDDVLQIIDKYR